MERNMNRTFLMLASAAILGLSLTAGRTAETPRPPRVSFVATSASQLQLGMIADDVIRVMGKAARETDSAIGSVQIRKLGFADAIPGQVILSDGKVSRVTLDPFRMDKGALPSAIRQAWPGLVASAVRRAVGEPSLVRRHTFFGIEVDQWIYARVGESDASVFFRDDRVIARAPGRDVPEDLFDVRLPLLPEAESEAPISAPRMGMTALELKELYGAARFRVDYTRNGQPASREVYAVRDSLVAFTFVNGVMTEFETLGSVSEAADFQGL
jgi:hypothetical protein